METAVIIGITETTMDGIIILGMTIRATAETTGMIIPTVATTTMTLAGTITQATEVVTAGVVMDTD
jgi:hypothetical protein